MHLFAEECARKKNHKKYFCKQVAFSLFNLHVCMCNGDKFLLKLEPQEHCYFVFKRTSK